MLIQRLVHKTCNNTLEEVCTINTSLDHCSIHFADRDLQKHLRLFGISIPPAYRKENSQFKDVSWVAFPDGKDQAALRIFITAFKMVELAKPSYIEYQWLCLRQDESKTS